MTLRGRLTAAFLMVVLCPGLLSAFLIGHVLTAAGHNRAVDRIDLAAAVVRTTLDNLCRRLRAAADLVAGASDADRARVADTAVARGLADVVVVSDAGGSPVLQIPAPPARPWADCAASGAADTAPAALAVEVELRAPADALLGTVAAVQVLDADFVARLAVAAGVEVTLIREGPMPAAIISTAPEGAQAGVVDVAGRLRGDAVAQADDHRYVRRIGPDTGQPLSLVLSVAPDGLSVENGLLLAAVVVAGLGVVVAWRSARVATRPLTELAEAADRVGRGDLSVRIPVRGHDEAARVAGALNRMTREIQTYAQVLAASRDQLRSHIAILGDTLSSTHDLQRILKLILRTAVVATSARAGMVLLFDRATGQLVCHAAEGVDELAPPGDWPVPDDPEHRPAAPQAQLGSGVLGTVAATGEPLRGRPGRDGPEPAAGEPCCHSYLAVPVVAPFDDGNGSSGSLRPGGVERSAPLPSVLGVLAVYDRLGSDEFDEADLATLRTFAGHAAVAVENVRVLDEAQRLSLTDPLTGLWNYRHLEASLRREMKRAHRSGSRLAVLALDLDRFKEVNDTHGHAAGDEVLVEFARRIRAVVREVDLAFRRGGEEFVVLLPDTDARGGAVVAERIGAAIRGVPVMVRPHRHPTPETAAVSVTVSIGIAVYPDHAVSGPRLLAAADSALYAAKAAGRDSYRMADPGSAAREEIPVPAGSVSPDGGLPTAGRSSDVGVIDGAGGTSVTSIATQPPRQSRGR